MPVMALRKPSRRPGSASIAAKKFSPPPFASFCGWPVRNPSVSEPQNGYNRALAISRMPPDVRRLRPVEEKVGFGSVRVPVAVSLQHAQGNECVQKVPRATRVEHKTFGQRFEVEGTLCQFRE